MDIDEKLDIIQFKLYRPYGEMLLRALELYSYNLHYIVKTSTDDYILKNIEIKYCYQELLNSLNNDYIAGYNCLFNCNLEIERNKRKNFYKNKKNIA